MDTLEITLYYKGEQYTDVNSIVNVLKVDYPTKTWDEVYELHLNPLDNYKDYPRELKMYKSYVKDMKKLWNNYESKK